jgi:hypothetical protein
VPPVRCDLGGAAGWPGEEEEAGAARPRRSRTTSRPTPSRTSSLGSPTASPALLRGVSTPLSPTLSSFSAPARRVFSFFSRSVAADSADARRCWGATNSRGAWRRERERERGISTGVCLVPNGKEGVGCDSDALLRWTSQFRASLSTTVWPSSHQPLVYEWVLRRICEIRLSFPCLNPVLYTSGKKK